MRSSMAGNEPVSNKKLFNRETAKETSNSVPATPAQCCAAALMHSCVHTCQRQRITASRMLVECQVEGLFYNYFSVGLDAQAAYGFHHLRETKAWAAPSRLINQAWYAYFSCASGWFCCAPPLNTTATLKVSSHTAYFAFTVSPGSSFMLWEQSVRC